MLLADIRRFKQSFFKVYAKGFETGSIAVRQPPPKPVKKNQDCRVKASGGCTGTVRKGFGRLYDR